MLFLRRQLLQTLSFAFGSSFIWKRNQLGIAAQTLDKMAAQLQAAGIAVKMDPQSYPNGRFARLRDPEGNPIELWQPAGSGASR